MICDEQDRSLDEFEMAMLAELLEAQGEFIDLAKDGGPPAKVVAFDVPRMRARGRLVRSSTRRRRTMPFRLRSAVISPPPSSRPRSARCGRRDPAPW
jgi:antitoxin (DNA-binding transcriptional repressor) of toxin-antitoxin stability system